MPWPVGVVLCLTLFVSRFFLPAESATLGGTLWIAAAWLGLGGAWFAWAGRTGRPIRKPDVLDLGIALLVTGHLIAAISSLLGSGDDRATINMIWEWLSLGVCVWLLRDVLTTAWGARNMVLAICLSSLVLSVLGMWQHFVAFPELASQWNELERLTAVDRIPSAAEQGRIQELQRELGLDGIARNAPARLLLNNRIAHSTEPIGRFALANTLAGLLVVGLLWSLAILVVGDSPPDRRLTRILWLLVVVSVSYCLWLTKSRTAIVGLLLGLVTWGGLSRSRWSGRHPSRWVIAALVLTLGLLPALAALLGGLDHEVLSESPKSLQYRLEYWAGTWGVISNHWLLGIGPGNFRQHYVRYKLPGSSEEILDPHNFVLDVWANGGVLALLGLGILAVVTFKYSATGVSRSDSSSTRSTESPSRPAGSTGTMIVVGVLAMLAAGCVSMLRSEGTDVQLLTLGLIWVVAAMLLSNRSLSLANESAAATASVVALTAHLSGAGGIAMPAISQVLLVLVALVNAHHQSSKKIVPITLAKWGPGIVAAGLLALCLTCILTAALPVTLRDASLQIGRAHLSSGASLSAAEEAISYAITSDPLASEPWRERAMLQLLKWERNGGSSDAVFEDAVEFQRQAIARDPLNANRYRELAELWDRRHARTGEKNAIEFAAAALEEALLRYPHESSLWGDLADASIKAGDTHRASEAAGKALELDALNRSRHHWDRVFGEERVQRLQGLHVDQD